MGTFESAGGDQWSGEPRREPSAPAPSSAERLRYLSRQAIDRIATRHVDDGDPILLVSMRRSGSTLLRDLIAQADGVRYVDQPDSPWSPLPAASVLPPVIWSHCVGASPAELNGLADFLEGVVRGDVYVRSEWRLNKSTFHRRTNRTVLKLLNSQAATGFLEEHLGGRTVVLLRSPIPTAQSIADRGWGDEVDLVLPSLVDTGALSDEETRACRSVLSLERGSIPRLVAEWLLLYRALCVGTGGHTGGGLDSGPDASGRYWVRFEDLRDDPGQILEPLYDHLGLEWNASYLNLANVPSPSTQRSQRSAPGRRSGGLDSIPERDRLPVSDLLDAFSHSDGAQA